MRLIVAVLLTAFAAAAPVSASVVYVSDVGIDIQLGPGAEQTATGYVFSATYSPDASPDPQVIFSLESREIYSSEYALDTSTTTPFILGPVFTQTVKLSANPMNLFAITDTGVYIFSAVLDRLYDYGFAAEDLVNGAPTPVVAVGNSESMAVAANGVLTIMADGHGYILDPTTGNLTLAFSQGGNNDGDAPGEFNDALYQAYGSNGLLYILDYGNNRVQVLDPTDSYSSILQFNLQPGVTTANMQFSIGLDGNLYLGDGQGGGSVYSATGEFLGAFTLPPGSYNVPWTDGISPYTTSDQAGDVFVYDATGIHRYLDDSASDLATPEPSSCALLGLGFGAMLWRKLTVKS